MIKSILKKVFDIREGEFRISFWMLSYIFLTIAVLLIVKPTVNALFLSELGVKQLPFAFLLVAVTAIISSFFYSKAVSKYPLDKIIKTSLISSVIILACLGVLLNAGIVSTFLLYFFYVWVAIYAVLSASQFWVLANLIYNVREAKRLFGFIGSGAILGGIMGGYLTTILAPFIGNENLVFVAAFLLLLCIPLLQRIWNSKAKIPGTLKDRKRALSPGERPLQLILKSKHLTYMACIVAVSVLVAKLIDYLFSDFASAAFSDTDELTAFFAFWFSTFNLLSLMMQLFFAHRIVGIWGVGFSLLLLPVGIFGAGIFFLLLPQLSAVVVIKAMDGILKQSVHKSASELLALPLPFDLKNKTKSFIDVVVDSLATGIAGCLLIFVIRGLELPSFYIGILILLLVGLWLFFILKVRQEYYKTFRTNLEVLTDKKINVKKGMEKPISVVEGMKKVFQNGTEAQLLFMLDKLMEINDKRFEEDVERLLEHPSIKVKTAAIQNLYFLNSKTMTADVGTLLQLDDDALTVATLAYVLRFSEKDTRFVYDHYLQDKNPRIANAALYCLAREVRSNPDLQERYHIMDRMIDKVSTLEHPDISEPEVIAILETIGVASLPNFYPLLSKYSQSGNEALVGAAVTAMGQTMYLPFLRHIIPFLEQKTQRKQAILAVQHYGETVIPILRASIQKREQPLSVLRFVPMAIQSFNSQASVKNLLLLLTDSDVTIRLEVMRALSAIRSSHPELKFDRHKVVSGIYEECKLYHQTLAAMHTQIIIAYRNRKKSKKEISIAEREARNSLLELLERRMDAGLERIFKLLGLRYQQKDVDIAYEGLLSEKQEARTNAIEFLDNLLTGDLKRKLLPIIEDSALDISSEDELQKIKHKVPSELECFNLLLNWNDQKIKLAVLFLVKQQGNPNYLSLVIPFLENPDKKVADFAQEAYQNIGSNTRSDT